MKFCFLFVSFALGTIAYASDGLPLAQDSADLADYSSGWSNGSNGGYGFRVWNLQTLTGSGNSNAGFYVVNASDHPDLKGAAKNGKAFGLFANGVTFEVASAFRGFFNALDVGQSMSVTWETGPFERKFDADSPSAGSVGFTLRTGSQGDSIEDYNKGARFEFGVYAGTPNYQIYDGQDDHDTGVPFTNGGVKVKLTRTNPDIYDLEITTLADQKTKTLTGRKLGGPPGATIDSICLFDRNWEKNDAYFNDLQILSAPAPAGSPSPAASPDKPRQ